MTPHIVITLAVIVVAMVLFAWNAVPPVVVGVCATLVLYFTGVLTVNETLSGFGDPVVVMLVGLFSIAIALDRAGVAAWAGQVLLRWTARHPRRRLIAIMLVAALFSGLIGMNGAVAAMLPVVVVLAARTRTAPSKLMIPLAFACLSGAQLSMLGSPVNVIASTKIDEAGLSHIPFFAWSLIGIPQLAGVVALVVLLGPRLLPDRPAPELPVDTQNIVLLRPEESPQRAVLDRNAYVALGILALLVALLAFGVVSPAIAAILCASLMVLFRVVTVPQLGRRMDWPTVILVAAMIPPAIAMTKTGAAKLLGDLVVGGLGEFGPIAVLAGLFLVTMVISQFISNTSSALVMLPIGLATAVDMHVSPVPMMLGVAMGAAASYLTPFANAVSLMVYGPGGYKFQDFWRLGLVVTGWSLVVTLAVVPLVWRF
ncbi:MAG: SLC13 family permease [Microbacteriaceae bacterium]|nr:SLC13 family permease [Microbacteriaceae bacterium]MCL2793939.1 SLC13 family permease [Microbacteriaceae bacterium]